MRLETEDRVVRVILSETNLRTLLAKLKGYPPDSACQIDYPTRDGRLLVVRAEPDKVHYANPERDMPGIRGRMHPDTEDHL